MSDAKLKGADVHVTVYVDSDFSSVAKSEARNYVRSNFLPDNVRTEFDVNLVETVGGFQAEVHASVVAETREVTL